MRVKYYYSNYWNDWLSISSCRHSPSNSRKFPPLHKCTSPYPIKSNEPIKLCFPTDDLRNKFIDERIRRSNLRDKCIHNQSYESTRELYFKLRGHIGWWIEENISYIAKWYWNGSMRYIPCASSSYKIIWSRTILSADILSCRSYMVFWCGTQKSIYSTLHWW